MKRTVATADAGRRTGGCWVARGWQTDPRILVAAADLRSFRPQVFYSCNMGEHQARPIAAETTREKTCATCCAKGWDTVPKKGFVATEQEKELTGLHE